MAAIKRTTVFVLVVLLTLFGAAVAQDDEQQQDEQNQQQAQTRTVGGEEFVEFGQVEVGEPEPYDSDTQEVDGVEVETGAIIFTGTTPGDQHPDVDLVGPDDYYHRFDFDDDAGAEHVIDGLIPGIYSIASTDADLNLVHTLVEVTPGQAVRVHLELERFVRDFQAGMVPAGQRAYPAQGFRTTRTGAINDPQFGHVTVETDNDDARFVMTGPDNYSNEFSGTFTATDLLPGVYVIAGTAEGAQVTTTTIEVEVSTEQTMVPAFVVTAETQEVDGDVAGGGVADDEQEQDDQQDDQTDDQQQDDDQN